MHMHTYVSVWVGRHGRTGGQTALKTSSKSSEWTSYSFNDKDVQSNWGLLGSFETGLVEDRRTEMLGHSTAQEWIRPCREIARRETSPP